VPEPNKSYFQPFLSYSKRDFGFEISYAFQAIVNTRKQEIISFEILESNPDEEPANSILSHVLKDTILLH
jgi:hypothetical protein